MTSRKDNTRQQMQDAKSRLLREEAKLLNTLGGWEQREDLWVRLALIDDFTAVEVTPQGHLVGKVVVHLRTRDSFKTLDNYHPNKLMLDAECCGTGEKLLANVDITLPWFGFILKEAEEVVNTEEPKAAEPKKARSKNPLLRNLEPVIITAPVVEPMPKPLTLRARVKAYVEANPGCNRAQVCKAFGGEETAEGRSSGSALTYLWQSSQILVEYEDAIQVFRGKTAEQQRVKLPREGTLLRNVYDYVCRNPGCKRKEVEDAFQMPGAGPALSKLKGSGLINMTLRLSHLLLANGKTRTIYLQHFSAN